MLVKNINGTGKNFPRPTCNCLTWIDHWIHNKNYKPTYCRGCLNKTTDLVGAHVMKCNSLDKSYYIVPLCNSCNHMYDQKFDVKDSDLVPVRVCK